MAWLWIALGRDVSCPFQAGKELLLELFVIDDNILERLDVGCRRSQSCGIDQLLQDFPRNGFRLELTDGTSGENEVVERHHKI
jgi:hypothetical protein